MNSEFSFEKQRIGKIFFGMDWKRAFTKKDFKNMQGDSDLRRQAKLPKSIMGYCAPLALETNGQLPRESAEEYFSMFSALLPLLMAFPEKKTGPPFRANISLRDRKNVPRLHQRLLGASAGTEVPFVFRHRLHGEEARGGEEECGQEVRECLCQAGRRILRARAVPEVRVLQVRERHELHGLPPVRVPGARQHRPGK